MNLDFTAVADWDAIEGWFSLDKAIAVQRLVKRLPPGARVAELGTFQGRSSVAIAGVLPPGGRLFCVDHFRGSEEHREMGLEPSGLLEAFCDNIRAFRLADRVEVLAMTTAQAARRFEADSLDLLLVDAAHDFESVRADLTTWYPKLKPGGYLVCDDYAPNFWPGVVRAIESLGLQGQEIAAALWAHVKPRPGSSSPSETLAASSLA
jgi:predicted O-methyltransferase YrrM